METDWMAHAESLREDINELEYWASKVQGREKMVLGRIADHLKQIMHDIEGAYTEPEEAEAPPDWVTDVDVDDLE